jgi:endonuclease/exonuclease/phosphatase (EEP) superfamily protein YafD
LPYVFAVGQYVIASRLPLRDCQIGQMGFRQESHRFAHCYVEIKGTKVELVTAHFQSPRQGLYAVRHDLVGGAADWKQNFTDRLTQSMKLARALLSNPMPRIVAGDLNADVASPVVRNLLETGLRDAYSDAGRGYGFTYGHAYRLGLAFLRIDHILVSREFGVIQCFVGEGNASQHRPVIADLVLRKAPS